MAGLQVLYQFCDSFSFLVLASIGLAIIYGMMGIINMAHGEFMMVGAYAATLMATNGIPLVLAVILAALLTGVYGLIIDRLIIRHLYSRPLDSVVATWGISLIMCQGMALLLGPSIQGTSTPLGSITVGEDSYSIYRILLTLIAIALVVVVYFVFMHTRFGLKSRATMQLSPIAKSLGVNTDRMYALTFMLGSVFAGLAGALYAPTMTITPEFGTNFMMQSFVTVIVGGANPLIGTVLSGAALGLVDSILSLLYGTFIGRIGLLAVAILFIRICPKGFSGLVENIRKNRRSKVERN